MTLDAAALPAPHASASVIAIRAAVAASATRLIGRCIKLAHAVMPFSVFATRQYNQ
jgi:hypothetical protein